MDQVTVYRISPVDCTEEQLEYAGPKISVNLDFDSSVLSVLNWVQGDQKGTTVFPKGQWIRVDYSEKVVT